MNYQKLLQHDNLANIKIVADYYSHKKLLNKCVKIGKKEIAIKLLEEGVLKFSDHNSKAFILALAQTNLKLMKILYKHDIYHRGDDFDHKHELEEYTYFNTISSRVHKNYMKCLTWCVTTLDLHKNDIIWLVAIEENDEEFFDVCKEHLNMYLGNDGITEFILDNMDDDAPISLYKKLFSLSLDAKYKINMIDTTHNMDTLKFLNDQFSQEERKNAFNDFRNTLTWKDPFSIKKIRFLIEKGWCTKELMSALYIIARHDDTSYVNLLGKMLSNKQGIMRFNPLDGLGFRKDPLGDLLTMQKMINDRNIPMVKRAI